MKKKALQLLRFLPTAYPRIRVSAKKYTYLISQDREGLTNCVSACPLRNMFTSSKEREGLAYSAYSPIRVSTQKCTEREGLQSNKDNKLTEDNL